MRAPRLLLAVLALLAACDRPAPPAEETRAEATERPPVVLISIDTLRADRLPAYGYDGVATPAIDALAADAVRFARAFSHVPLTLPAHASLFSGLLPADVGVRDNAGYRVADGFAPYLPVLLRDAGYATAAAVSSYALRADTGVGQGFERYDDEMDRAASGSLFGAERAGERTWSAIRPWLASAAAAPDPFFLFLHLYEPHLPYTPPEAFAARWGASYEAEIAAADAVVGELLAALRAHGVYDRALIVLLSDHGEGLGDHGEQGHGVFLYREAIQVPLLIKLPGGARAGTAVEPPVRLIDVLPTLLEVAAIETPDEVGGTSLLDLIEGQPTASDAPRPVYAETLYPRLHFGWSDLAALIEWPYAYIEAPEPELYDLEADPEQRDNVLAGDRRVYAALRARLAVMRAPFAPPALVEDEETRKRLAALGYLASAGDAGDAPLPDPKHRLARAQRLLDEGLAAFDGGRFAEALPAFRTLVDENPGMVDAWENLGNALVALERPEEALEAYRQALERSGGAPRVAFLMARALLRLERLDGAEKHAALAAGWNDELVAGLRARIATAWEARGLAALEGGRPAEALGALERALALDADDAGSANAWNLLAVARFQLGERGGAIEAWERAVAADPGHLDALYNLAFQAADLGRADLARRTLRRYLEIAPPERYGRELAQARALLERLGAGP